MRSESQRRPCLQLLLLLLLHSRGLAFTTIRHSQGLSLPIRLQPTVVQQPRRRQRTSFSAADVTADADESTTRNDSPDNSDSSHGPPNKKRVRIARLLRKCLRWPASNVTTFWKVVRKRRWMKVALLCFVTSMPVAYRSYHRQAILPAPIEISYSHFLRWTALKNSDTGRPVLDQVRIGEDRIVYRVDRAATAAADAQDETTQRLLAAPKKKKKRKQSSSAQFVPAYTRTLPRVADANLLTALRKHDVSYTATGPAPTHPAVHLVRMALLYVYMVVLWKVYRSITQATRGPSTDSPGKSFGMTSLTTFDDIEGLQDAKFAVMEFVDTIRNPTRYVAAGARPPRGLLLAGPPGTGKTLLARATAGTTGWPLLGCSGADFVEIYVGRGAARVRALFAQAQALANPKLGNRGCLIFIDELDAVGRARGNGNGLMGTGSNDEAEQTLNQLLACMDGLDNSNAKQNPICVLAATNRKEILDPALIRPGRFDRIVTLELPDARGREAILRVHAQKLPDFTEGSGVDSGRLGALGIGPAVDLGAVASVTDGLSGAELEYIVNEAAIRAVRRNTIVPSAHPSVTAVDFEQSVQDFMISRRPNEAANVIRKMFK